MHGLKTTASQHLLWAGKIWQDLAGFVNMFSPKRHEVSDVMKVWTLLHFHYGCVSMVTEVYEYIIITIVQSYTGKYHEFVAVCIVTSAQHE